MEMSTTKRGDKDRKFELGYTKNEKECFPSNFLPSFVVEQPVATSQINKLKL